MTVGVGLGVGVVGIVVGAMGSLFVSRGCADGGQDKRCSGADMISGCIQGESAPQLTRRGENVTKSDIRLAEERVKRLENEVELFQTWFDKGGELREKIIKKVNQRG